MKKVLITVVMLLSLIVPANVGQANACSVSKLPIATKQDNSSVIRIQLATPGNCSSYASAANQKLQLVKVVKKNVCINNGKTFISSPSRLTLSSPQINENARQVIVTSAPAPSSTVPVQQTAPSPVINQQPDPPSAASPVYSPGEMQNEMLGYVNAERAKANLAPLSLDQALCDGAYLKSKDMADNNYFDHTSPTYGSPFDMMKSLGITYRTAGENIAKHITVIGAHDAFMNSPGHRANILSAQFNKAGFGFVQAGQYIYITQWFTN